MLNGQFLGMTTMSRGFPNRVTTTPKSGGSPPAQNNKGRTATHAKKGHRGMRYGSITLKSRIVGENGLG